MEQITVEKVERKEKSGSLLGSGKWYKVPLNLVNNYTIGRTYNVEPEPSDFKGTTYYWLKKTPKEVMAGPQGAEPPPLNGSYNQTPAPAPPRPQANGGYSEVEKSGYIFITGCLQQALGSGKFDTQDIPLIAQALVDAWNAHVKGKL